MKRKYKVYMLIIDWSLIGIFTVAYALYIIKHPEAENLAGVLAFLSALIAVCFATWRIKKIAAKDSPEQVR